MLITIDKRGSINLPLAVRKALGLESGSSLDLSIEDGGSISLHPVAIYRTVRLSDNGLIKLQKARDSGKAEFPVWLRQGMENADADSNK